MNTNDPFFLSIKNEKQGPFTHAQIMAMHQDQSLQSATLYWQQGMEDWAPIQQLQADLGPTTAPPTLSGPTSGDRPRAPATANNKNLIIAGYTCTVLTIIPLLGYLLGLVAMILGVQMCRKNLTLHGVINIVAPLVIGFVMVPILLITVLTMMQSSIQETFDRVTAELEAMDSTQTFPYASAAEYYAERLATPLTPEEQTIAGNWSGENIDFEWEIMRSADGTYALAFRYPDDETYGEDIVYGIWGIEDGQFYYMDLEVVGYRPDEPAEKLLEEIETLTADLLITTYVDEDDRTIRSTEKRVTQFQFDIWDDLDADGRYPKNEASE